MRRFVQRLDHIGVAVAVLFFICSLTPSLLPRSWPLQGTVTGITSIGGYGVGVAISRTAGWIGVPAPSQRFQRWAGRIIAVLALVAMAVVLWLSARWQQDIRRAIGKPPSGGTPYLGVLLIAAVVFLLLLGLARLIRRGYRGLAGWLVRFLPRSLARLLAVLVVAGVVVGLLTGVIYDGLIHLAEVSYAAQDRGTEPGIVRPALTVRSGSPSSVVSWDSLGLYGRSFVASGPTQAQISQLTGRPAATPIRVFAGLRSAGNLQGEAQLVLAELKRTGAFDRPVLAVATTTGRGWVDPALVNPMEYLYDGDTATAAIQYSSLPSWISFLADRQPAKKAGRELFDTIYDYWATLPPAHRPRLVVFAESLGVFGGEAAFSGVADVTNRTSGVFFAGPPNSSGLWREITEERVKGSPERLPRYGDGQTVRFADDAADLRQPDGRLSHPTLVYLEHASDPIVWWSPALIWRRPDWLAEPRGPDVVADVRWYPFVTFWQLSCDLAVGVDAPAGHGHNYGGSEVIASWTAILQPPNWTAANAAALQAKRGL